MRKQFKKKYLVSINRILNHYLSITTSKSLKLKHNTARIESIVSLLKHGAKIVKILVVHM